MRLVSMSQFQERFFEHMKIHIAIPLNTRISAARESSEFILMHVRFVAKKVLLWLNAHCFPANKNAPCLNVPVPEALFRT